MKSVETHPHLNDRLLPYFDGNYCVEEILWREKITRRDLYSALEKLKSTLIVAHSTDIFQLR